jgi:hypothetical protein
MLSEKEALAENGPGRLGTETLGGEMQRCGSGIGQNIPLALV